MTRKPLYKQQVLTCCFTNFFRKKSDSNDVCVTAECAFWDSNDADVFTLGSDGGYVLPEVTQKKGRQPGDSENAFTPHGQLVLVYYISPQCDWAFRNATNQAKELTNYPNTPLISTENNSDFMVLGWGAPPAKITPPVKPPLSTDKLLVIWDANKNHGLFKYKLALTDETVSGSKYVWDPSLDPQIKNDGSGGANMRP